MDMGPSAMRIADIGPAVRGLGLEFEDHGNVEVREPESMEPEDVQARFLPEISDCCARLRSRVEAILEANKFPLVVGGDHSIACGTIAGLASHYHKQGKKIGLIWFDAHGDMNTPETTESGNIHGMPLASCLGYGPSALTQLADLSPMVDVSNVTLIGIRCPTPYGPPVHPVLSSQTFALYFLIRSASISAYSLGRRGRNGPPKHGLKFGCGSVTPASVPASFDVYPLMK